MYENFSQEKTPLLFHYHSQNMFTSAKEKDFLYKQAMFDYWNNTIPREYVERGRMFQWHICNNKMPNFSVQYINPKVGYGLFAEENLKPNTFCGEYVGLVRKNDRHGEWNHYLFSHPQKDSIQRNYVIDATSGNWIRFVNHSYCPNSFPYYAFVGGFYHVILITISEICRGEQLTYDYGRPYWEIRCKPEEM